jgi:hypothetical protein
MGCPLDLMDVAQSRAMRSGYVATRGGLTSHPPSHPCWHANAPPSPFLPHENRAAHTLQNLQVFIAVHDEPSMSPHFQPTEISSPLSCSMAHFLHRDLPEDISFLRSATLLWCVPHFGVLKLSGDHTTHWSWLTLLLYMPRPRGKPRRGAAWYQARGREPPSTPRAVSTHCISDIPPPSAPMDAHPPEEGSPPPLTHLVIPSAPSEPAVDPVTDLSPLSNPYGCRVEWFDHLGNSIGYAPPPPSPPRRPLFPPPPPPFSSLVSFLSILSFYQQGQ